MQKLFVTFSTRGTRITAVKLNAGMKVDLECNQSLQDVKYDTIVLAK